MDGEGQYYSRTDYPRAQPRPGRSRLFVAVILLGFVVTIVAMAPLFSRWTGGFDLSQAVTGQPGMENASGPSALPSGVAGEAATGTTGFTGTLDGVNAQVLDLEQRLMHVSIAAQSASGYANRAEAIMVAFAARRSLDAGSPLGYIEGQLRLLFGEAQPKAVATIINAGSEPVTINKLRAGLEDINLLVLQGDPNESWWNAAMRELGSLAVIRKAGSPPPEPEQRLARARRAVEAGQIEDAMADVAALRQLPAIAQWLEQARRYNEAHRALDVIEAAAILEPRAAPIVTAAPQQGAVEKPGAAAKP